MKKLINQILKFGIVGVIATLVDYSTLILLTEFFGINYLLSSGLAYCTSTILNYILSMKYVFKSKEDRKKQVEFLLFFVLSIIGLGFNQIVMWFATELLHLYYVLSKIGATAIVMVYNFISRKLLLEKE